MGVPPNQKYQADNLAKLWREFLPVLELIAKIFGAVSRTKAKCGSRCCLQPSDDVAAMTAFVRAPAPQLLIIHYSLLISNKTAILRCITRKAWFWKNTIFG